MSNVISIRYLEKFLDRLSAEPKHIYVQLEGPFDYSALESQVMEIVPAAVLDTQNINPSIELSNPTKAMLLEIHKRYMADADKPVRRVRIREAVWLLYPARNCKINLTPERIVETTSTGRDMLDLRNVLEGSGVEFILKTRHPQPF